MSVWLVTDCLIAIKIYIKTVIKTDISSALCRDYAASKADFVTAAVEGTWLSRKSLWQSVESHQFSSHFSWPRVRSIVAATSILLMQSFVLK